MFVEETQELLTTTIALATVLAQQAAPQNPANALALTPPEITAPIKDSAKTNQVDFKSVKTQVAEIIKTEVSVRASASIAGSILMVVNKGIYAKLVETNGDWVRLSFPSGTVGWVHKAMVKLSEPKTTAVIVPAAKPVETPVVEPPANVNALPDTPERAEGDVDHTRRLSITIANGKESIRRPDPVKPAAKPLDDDGQDDTPPVKPLTRPNFEVKPAKAVSVPVVKPGETVVKGNSPFGADPVSKPAHVDGGMTGDAAVPANASPSAEAVLKSANSLMGSRYVWGATGSRGAYDCSGFTGFVFRQNGVDLPRTAAEQSQRGTGVDRHSLQAGDLVFFTSRSSGGRAGHVGIYIGNDYFIHCSSGAGQVVVSNLNQTYYADHYIGARRVLSGSQKFNNPIPLPTTVDNGDKGEDN